MEDLIDRELKVDKIIEQCEKIKSLGSVMSYMAWDCSNGDGGLINLAGECFGLIVNDYADAISDTIQKLSPVLRDYFKYNGVSLLDRARTIREMLEDGRIKDWETTLHARACIKEIGKLINCDVPELVKLNEYFEEKIEKVISEHSKKAA